MKALSRPLKILVVLLAGMLSAATLGVFVVGGAYLYFSPKLPEAGDIGITQFDEPLRIYTADGKLLAKYGLQRRIPVAYQDIPKKVIHAFLAAEDDRFFEHPGVDYQGILRAAWNLLLTGEKSQGGSTITMQLARNLFLTPQQTYVRKIKEIFIALQMEAAYSKAEILELYLNKIYLGNSAYGVGAAAKVYYDKPLSALTIAQVATIAGLPKAPSYYNPAEHPERAQLRRDYVLRRMHELGYIDDQKYQLALAKPVETVTRVADDRYEADYLAEMVRQKIVERYGEKAAYTKGFEVTTTIQSETQRAANRALRRALLAYDRRHQWRGAEAKMPVGDLGDVEAMNAALAERPEAGGLVPAVVLAVSKDRATLYTDRFAKVELPGSAMPWLDDGESAAQLLAPGDIVRLAYTGDEKSPWLLAQIPAVQGALVALDPFNGAIKALIGGFEFNLSKYNRAVQARRQPGSSFKPFLYSAALANGFTPASIINDAPVVFDAPGLSNDWRPENYSGRIHGPTRLREGLVHSRNLVSIRLLRAVGVDAAIDHIEDFGLPADRMPRDLSMALGTATFSPLQMARADAVFANGGFLVDPFFIREIRLNDEVIFRANPPIACNSDCRARIEKESGGAAPEGEQAAPARATPVAQQAQDAAPAETESARTESKSPATEDPPPRFAPRVISAQNAYLMRSMMHDVIQRGTGRRALQLGRSDLAGKTGTTNQQRDAWFTGYNHALVAVVWVGFDQLKPLGPGETGSQAALPMWIDFMNSALEGVPEKTLPRPPGLVTVRIDPDSGLLANGPEAIFETFRAGQVPQAEASTAGSAGGGEVERLF